MICAFSPNLNSIFIALVTETFVRSTVPRGHLPRD